MASLRGPGLAKMYSRPREALLSEFSIQYVPEIKRAKEAKEAKEAKDAKERAAAAKLALQKKKG
jgi:hypothetical protein